MLVDISGPFFPLCYTYAQKDHRASTRVSTSPAAAFEAAPEAAAAAAGAAAAGAREAGRTPERAELEAVPQPATAAAAAETAAADADTAAAVSGEGRRRRGVHPVVRPSRSSSRLEEGLPDLLQPRFRRDRLHLAYEPGQVPDEVGVQLQVAVASPFDPQGVVRLPRQLPQLSTVRPVHHIIICPMNNKHGAFDLSYFLDIFVNVKAESKVHMANNTEA